MRLSVVTPVVVLTGAVSAMLAGSAVSQELREVTGTALVRERIALPEEMVLAVEARGPFGVGLAEDWIDGNAVTEFALDVPVGVPVSINLALIGATDGGGRLAFTAGPFPIAADSAGADLGEVPLTRYDMAVFPLYLTCSAMRVGVGVAPGAGDDSVMLDIDGTRLILSEAPAAAGIKYAAADDPGTWLWNRGEDVSLSLQGELHPCVMADPVTWEGRGEGWQIVVTGNQVDFSERVAYVLIREGSTTDGVLDGPLWTDGAVLMAGDPVAVRVWPAVCAAGPITFPERVEVLADGEGLAGCGGDPADLLTGKEWIVEDIGGGGRIDSARVTLAFADDGSVAGQGGCNRWSGTWSLGTGLRFGPAVTTRMACAEAVMLLEQAFFAALGATAGFAVDESGALVLTDAEGRPLLVARR